MEIQDNTTKQAYIQLLTDTLEKKKKILIWLMNVTEQQEEIFSSDPFDEAVFNQTISIKEEHLNTLAMLDEGFEKVYEGVRDELSANREKYIMEINMLKNLITDITDLSVKLQVLEKRNKTKIEHYFSQKRKGIRDSRMSSKTVSNYYKTMTKQHEAESVFYDKKK